MALTQPIAGQVAMRGRAQAAEIVRISPNFSVEERAKFIPCKNQAT